jgi:hypothetical protein
MLAFRESTRLHVAFFFFQEGKRKSPGKPVQLPGLTGQNTKPSKFVSAVRAAFLTTAV